jgi:hypothetical protein
MPNHPMTGRVVSLSNQEKVPAGSLAMDMHGIPRHGP